MPETKVCLLARPINFFIQIYLAGLFDNLFPFLTELLEISYPAVFQENKESGCYNFKTKTRKVAKNTAQVTFLPQTPKFHFTQRSGLVLKS